MIQSFSKPRPLCFRFARAKVTRRSWERGSIFFVPRFRHDVIIACVAWRFCQEHYWAAKPQSPRGFSALARLYYLARPAKTAMLRRLTWSQPSCFFLFTLLPWFHHFLILLVFYRNLPDVSLKDMRSYALSKNTVFLAVGEKRYRCFSSLYCFHSAETWLSLRQSLWYF